MGRDDRQVEVVRKPRVGEQGAQTGESIVGLLGQDEASGGASTYTLVSAGEAAPGEGRLSMESPMAAALQGLRAGEVARVQTPRGERRLRIVSVS